MRRSAAIAVCAVALATGVAAVMAAGLSVASPPTFAAARAAHCPSDARLLDRHGAVLQESRIDPRGRRLPWVALDAISPALTDAVLQSEDRRFFAHGGVDGRAVAAAVWQRLRGGAPRGASTLSMQVAALLDPALHHGAAPRTLAEKWRQMRAAWALETTWTKPQILEAYLNLVSFRGELQGVGAAAQVLYGKAPHGLSAGESAVLAALLRAPNADRQALQRRAAQLAGDSPDLDGAIGRVFAARDSGLRLALAPHAARRVLGSGRTRTAECTEGTGETGSGCGDCAGSSSTSTLDRDTQRYATASLRRHLLAIRDRSVRDAAVLVADNATGEVLAYVGASGDLSNSPQVDGVQARRQAGSTLKPFLYARALDRHLLTAASLLDDTPLEVSVGPGLFRPRNYDEQFRGLVPLRSALAGSLNVPAVRTLLLVGTEDFAAQLRQLGFSGVAESGDYYGPSLALGSADVTLWELVNAYRTLANGGVWTPLLLQNSRAIAAPARSAPFGAAAAFVVSDILSDRDSRSVTFGLESALSTPFWTAVKTGTSKDMRDNWCIGFSRRYTVGVWVGNFSGEPMRDVSGVTGAAPIWADIIGWLHRDLPSDAPSAPAALERASVGAGSAQHREWFLTGTAPDGETRRALMPRIVAPADGSVIALDPDIPPARQRVAFEAAAAGDARWLLDGADVGPGNQLLLWSPTPGTHALQLIADDAQLLGAVAFEVRG